MAAPIWNEQLSLMIAGASRGMSGQAVLNELREAGLGVRRQQFYRLWGTARAVAAEAGLEPTRPLDQAPDLSEMPPVATRAAEGYLHTVRLVYREAETGNQRVVFHSTKSDTPLTRQEAIDQAIAAYEGHSEEYDTTLIAAVHTSAIHLVPVVLEEQ